jgi:hypothetical protein
MKGARRPRSFVTILRSEASTCPLCNGSSMMVCILHGRLRSRFTEYKCSVCSHLWIGRLNESDIVIYADAEGWNMEVVKRRARRMYWAGVKRKVKEWWRR